MKLTFYRGLKVIQYVFFLMAVVILTDVLLLRQLLNFGYPRHLKEENEQRFPFPYIEFKGKPAAGEHNEWGFRGRSFQNPDSSAYRVAFFGGSTGYYGDPPIPDIIGDELEKLCGKKVFVANFSVISSGHRQHLHEAVEYFPFFKPDIVIFYGGYNETMQHALCDPRPGYPYNFYYRRELSSFRKLILEYSAILGEIDLRSGFISGLRNLQHEFRPYSAKWNNDIADYYFETMRLAKNMTEAYDSKKFGTPVFLGFYQPFQYPGEFEEVQKKMKAGILNVPYLFDLSDLYLPLTKDIYKDIVHVKQPANQLMGKIIASIVHEKAFLVSRSQ